MAGTKGLDMDDATQIRVNAGAGPAVVRSRPAEPCVVVIFGVTGDLTHRKLIPALYNLAREGDLPEKYAVIGTSTSVPPTPEFRDQLKKSTAEFSRSKPLDEGVWNTFAAPMETVVADVNAPGDYATLGRTIEAVEAKHGDLLLEDVRVFRESDRLVVAPLVERLVGRAEVLVALALFLRPGRDQSRIVVARSRRDQHQHRRRPRDHLRLLFPP